ncbi:hypothetical protein NDU88_001140 [Pleurodeles waltl]|uniref:Uncharacterized protein n=1 Tax=Pleurodeles waltl TaxID=8319 RepID=A0AAV7Q2U0_PLEWA|nr:hypothetical protein NDU88_001140 [Pleurodeles waltl]
MLVNTNCGNGIRAGQLRGCSSEAALSPPRPAPSECDWDDASLLRSPGSSWPPRARGRPWKKNNGVSRRTVTARVPGSNTGGGAVFAVRDLEPALERNRGDGSTAALPGGQSS